MGGDWNMTTRQKDQKLNKYNPTKNEPLQRLEKTLRLTDVWKRLK